MTPETIKTFLRQYVHSLSEETQRTAKGDRFGFDYLIQQLGAAERWILHRAPSHPPATSDDLPQPKKEEEHGVDFGFLTQDRRELIIFVLKDEKLTYKGFESHNFRTDLSRASAPNLKEPELTGVTSVRVILAYNKGEEDKGVAEFDRLVIKLGTKVGDSVALRFERWNLDRLVDELQEKVFTTALLPENFFRKFAYLCLQVENFTHGSAQWEEVLIRDWREFVKLVLADPTRRSVWMLAVALAVVREHGKNQKAFATGWIELVEWALLGLWDAALRTKDKKVSGDVWEIWSMSYVIPLEQFYAQHDAALATEDSLAVRTEPAFQAAAGSYVAFWHLARLGLLWQSVALLPVKEDSPQHAAFVKGLEDIVDRIIRMHQANAGALRPVMDSHHIELFLVWAALYGVGRTGEIAHWIQILSQRIATRRREGGPLRVFSTENTWESVFETIADGQPLTKAYGRSSYLLLMLEEMCLGLPDKERDRLLKSIHEHIVLGVNGKGESLKYQEEVELVSWAPPKNWERLMLTGELENQTDNGVSITTGNFVRYPNEKDTTIAERLRSFVEQTRERYPLKRETNIPLPVLLLACVKYRTPIPPEFWRSAIFGKAPEPPAEKSPLKPKRSKKKAG
ncbi:MAG: hypothetical protein PSV13_16120 [Lacunisphaera sp.]|nr:hypothetical protein [Lacunisphaera sp.]